MIIIIIIIIIAILLFKYSYVKYQAITKDSATQEIHFSSLVSFQFEFSICTRYHKQLRSTKHIYIVFHPLSTAKELEELARSLTPCTIITSFSIVLLYIQ